MTSREPWPWAGSGIQPEGRAARSSIAVITTTNATERQADMRIIPMQTRLRRKARQSQCGTARILRHGQDEAVMVSSSKHGPVQLL
jgi:hypothetical protein